MLAGSAHREGLRLLNEVQCARRCAGAAADDGPADSTDCPDCGLRENETDPSDVDSPTTLRGGTG